MPALQAPDSATPPVTAVCQISSYRSTPMIEQLGRLTTDTPLQFKRANQA
ncbi:hypothetical protein B0G81_7953 [Paraburkholderia sp. BL6665CI2N2]|nr:hypothetical protein B0G81_7953 [Paraburkholderia sp. BL6665CI2N2]